MINLNLTANGYFACPLGYPFRMSQSGEVRADGVMSRQYSQVTATVAADTTATAHLALFMPPILTGQSDLGVIVQVDQPITAAQQTITATLPTASLIPVVSQIPAGSIALTAGSTTVTGTGTSFVTDGSWNGYLINVNGDKNLTTGALYWYTISSVSSATSMAISVKSANTASGQWFIRPSSPLPQSYIMRFWIDGIVDTSTDTISRQPNTAGYSTSQNPGIPKGVTVYSLVAS